MHLLSEIIYVIAYRLIGYRRGVTRTNLAKAYPQLSAKERKLIEKAYYHHISDLLVEGFHNLYACPQTLMKRYKFVNRQLVNEYYDRGESVILMSAHYNNWEYMISSLNFQLMHHGVGVGKPLEDKLVAKYITRRRSRYGTEIVDHTDVRQVMDFFHEHKVPTAYMMLSDQSPSNERKSYWTTFMNQETPFLYGAEYFARKYDMPVLYYEVTKVRRGYYEVRFEKLCDKPSEAEPYAITKAYVRRLTETINKAPQYWLWSHKRWKRSRPKDVPIYD